MSPFSDPSTPSTKLERRIILAVSVLLLIIGMRACSSARASGTEFVFKLVSGNGGTVVLQPVLPAQMQVTRLEGENPTTSIFQCTVVERKQADTTKHLLKCGSAIYSIDGILFSH